MIPSLLKHSPTEIILPRGVDCTDGQKVRIGAKTKRCELFRACKTFTYSYRPLLKASTNLGRNFVPVGPISTVNVRRLIFCR